MMNIISKDGGNRFTGSLPSSYSNKSLQNDNLDDELQARRPVVRQLMDRVFDYSGVVDQSNGTRFWFYG